jgi:hypothetical protein
MLTAQRRIAETVNNILTFQHDDSRIRTAAEVAAGVTPINYAYPVGDIRRYGAKIDGITDDTGAINSAIAAAVASGGCGYIYHPGGTCVHSVTITVPNNLSVIGFDRTACIFTYTGTVQGWLNTNPINSSGNARVYFRNVTLFTNSGGNTAGAIEWDAGGWSYYTVERCAILGTWKFGIISSAAEIVRILNNVFSHSGPTNAANIWLVNGADRIGGQASGFSNDIHVIGNQLDITGTGSFNLIDDGGAGHRIRANNINGGGMMARFAGCEGLDFSCNGMENGGFQDSGTTSNVQFSDTTKFGGVNVLGCQGGEIIANTFGADYANGNTLEFVGGTMHQGLQIHGNRFRHNLGRNADIDITKLSNSCVGPNYSADVGGQHYAGQHNDADGNELWPPQNGTSVGFSDAAHVYADTRYPHRFYGGVDAKSAAAGLQVDAQKWQNFCLQIVNSAGTLNTAILQDFVDLAASAYADKVVGGSNAFNALPANLDSTHGFTAGWGLLASDNSILLMNTATQPSGAANMQAFISTYDGNVTRCRVKYGLVSRNINGTTAVRPELRLIDDMTGAAVNINTTLIPANKSLVISFSGYLA